MEKQIHLVRELPTELWPSPTSLHYHWMVDSLVKCETRQKLVERSPAHYWHHYFQMVILVAA